MMEETYREYAKRMAREYADRLSQKPLANEEELGMYHPISHSRSEIKLGNTFIRLNSEEEPDRLDPVERIISNADDPRWDRVANQPQGFGTLPDRVSHVANQTPIKHQEDRGTCVCFATLAAMEAIIKVEQHREINLSEQYANWVLMAEEGKRQCDDGLRTTLAARYLKRRGVCEEADFKYEDRITVSGHCDSVPPPEALHKAKFGIKEFAIIEGLGLFGPSLGNPDYLESVLFGGYDIVFGTQVAWGLHDENFIFDIILDKYGNPIQSGGGHCMLMVGYDRNKGGSKPFFIMKNSWGTLTEDGLPMGKDGYFFLSYDYIRNYAKNGFIIKSISTDMPTI